MSFYSEQSYTDLADRLEKACQWLSDVGVEISQSRLAHYRALLSKLATLQREGRPEDLLRTHDFGTFLNALHEATEIVAIVEALRKAGQHDSAMVPRFRKGLRGHQLHALDNDGRSGRDFTFELQVAADFERQGFKVNFGAEADVETVVDEHPFFVECKRLRSPSKVEMRIKDALRQLETRYDSSPEPTQARGLVAVSIGKLENPEFNVLAANTEQELTGMAGGAVWAFVRVNARFWRQVPSPRTLGVLVCFDVMGIKNLPQRTPVTIHRRGLVPLVQEGMPDHALFLRIADVFRRGGA